MPTNALIALIQPEAPMHIEEPTSLYVDIALPDHLACEVSHQPHLLEDLAQRAFAKIKRYWVQQVETGGMAGWQPLASATVARKQQQGVGTPTYPMVGPHQSVANMLRTMPGYLTTERNQNTYAALMAFGPGPGQDQHPSERYSDLFWGSPKSPMEAMAYGKRGVIPARPLYFNQVAKDIIKEELRRWAAPLAETPEQRFCFEEAISFHDEETTLPTAMSPTSKLSHSSAPQYLLER